MYQSIPFNRIISAKPKSSYPKQIQNEFSLLSVDKNNSSVIGSYSYRLIKSPGDVDLYEQVEDCCSIDQVVDKFIDSLKIIVRDVLLKPNHYFMEVKIGLDHRFMLNPKDFNFPLHIEQLFNEGLLSKEEFTVINDCLHSMNQECTEIINELLRKHYILRWSIPEIFAGVKILPGGIKLTLQQAALAKSKINIEIINFLNGRFIDESNFFVLVEVDKNGGIHMINLPQESYTDFENYFITGLKSSIQTLWYSKLNFGPFKMLKRYFSLAKFQKNQALINKLIPILTSDFAILNQIKGDIGTLIKLLKKAGDRINMNLVFNEISNFKDRLANILYFSNDDILVLNDKIDKIVDGSINIFEGLEHLEKFFKNIVNNAAIKYVKKNGLVPNRIKGSGCADCNKTEGMHF